MKDISDTLKYKGKDYKLVFNFNVLEETQAVYGTLTKWVEEAYGKKTGEPSAKALTFMLTLMINEGIDIENEDREEKVKPLTLKQVGRLLSEIDLNTAVSTIDELMGKSIKGGENSKNE